MRGYYAFRPLQSRTGRWRAITDPTNEDRVISGKILKRNPPMIENTAFRESAADYNA